MKVEKEGAAISGLKGAPAEIHVENIPQEEEESTVNFKPKSVIFKITEFFQDPQQLYDRTRGWWKMSAAKANIETLEYAYSYAARERKIVACYHITKWLGPNEDGRFGFEGYLEFNDPMVGQPVDKIAHARGGVVFYGDNIMGTPATEESEVVEQPTSTHEEKPTEKKNIITPMNEGESKIKVHGKAKGWTALGIADAYTKIHPSATLEDLNKAFPRELFASTKTYKESLIDKKVYLEKATAEGDERTIEWLNTTDWFFTLEDGTEVIWYKITWSEGIFPKIVEQAKSLGIEVASFENIGRGKGRGEYEIEYLPDYSFHVDGRMTVNTLQRQFREAFNAGLRVYEPSGKKAHPNAILAKLRTTSDATEVGEFEAKNDMKVMDFEYKMKSIFGINVQVALADDSKLSKDDSMLKDAGRI